MSNSISALNKSVHQKIQESMLYICNISLLIGFIFLGFLTFSMGQTSISMIAFTGALILTIALILLKINQYTGASYLTIIILTIASYGALLNRNKEITPDLLYLFNTYEVVPIILSGILAQKRSFTIIISCISISLMCFYLFTIQGPAIGYKHIVSIAGSFTSMIICSILSDRIYSLTGQIMNMGHEEIAKSNYQKKQLMQIISAYNNNKEKGSFLDTQTSHSDSKTTELQEIIQKFSEDLHDMDKALKDSMIRSNNTYNSTQNILQIFTKQRESLQSYKEKVEQISETSQEIEFIVQNRKVQMTELIDLSEQGASHMQNSVLAVEKVAENSKNMLDMISLIMEVAERTNILALNAAVEASRAGKAGGGFAIVAKEIKSLSTETTENAEIINKTLRTNIKAITEAVEIIRNVGRSFSGINTSIIDFSSSIDDILQRINNLNQENSHMSLDTKNILSLIEEIQSVLEKTIFSIEQEHKKTKEIQSLSTILTGDVKNVNQNTNTIRDASKKIQENLRSYIYSIQQVEDIVKEIEQQI